METKIMMLMLLFAMVMPLLLERPVQKIVSQKLQALGMNRLNYRGDTVLTACGLILVCSATLSVLVLEVLLLLTGATPEIFLHGFLLMAGMSAMAYWGWRDDRASDPEAKGFRGHFGMLWRERRVTSGIWKLIGGSSTAICISLFLSDSLWTWAVSFGLLALSPNIINLVDLRPARAIKVFWFLISLAGAGSLWTVEVTAGVANWIFLIPVILASILMFTYDAGGRMMLGDTGANALGFVVGYSFVMGTPTYVQVSMLVVFIFMQVAAEFYSFSRVIERVSWLQRLDEWGRTADADQEKNQTGSSGLV
ncbi:UDP-N-acetylmuramyl pentapeptide phosphotransferase [Brevibacillus sp. 179-C9.3 HS]|uniref:UDP-N-acetylmuramyl pentapeptide phosphotransferase n=1 Tax=unclassified Brevibacillus TaxID=2684853 RepID=UPI00399F42D5